MKIKQIRLGFANNSSSSHSIIHTKQIQNICSDDAGFGWDFFTCADKESKERYLFATLIAQLDARYLSKVQFYGKRSIGNINEAGSDYPYVLKLENKYRLQFGYYHDWKNVFKNVTLNILNMMNMKEAFECYDGLVEQAIRDGIDTVDHQSVLIFPKDSKTGVIHEQFAKDLIKYIVNEDFVILGGNDNDSEEHEYSSMNDGHVLLNFLRSLTENDGVVVVRDEPNEDYVIQDNSTGNIFRVSFSNDEETHKSSVPTLVDISITSYCDKGCKFCYQSSSIHGKHADKNHVFSVLDKLKKAGVLEIVFGGGEPTSHPDFSEILKYAKNLGFVVSFTTRNYTLDSHPAVKHILDNTKSIAFSCNTPEDVEKVVEYDARLDAKNIWFRGNTTIQNILGLTNLEGLKEFLDECSNNYITQNVSLLGYKEFGFGANRKSENVDGWIDLIKTYVDDNENKCNLSFGIDSIVVKKYKDELISSGIDYRMLVAEEGKFSCYIDTVNNTIASSSFTNTKFQFDDNWLETYKSF